MSEMESGWSWFEHDRAFVSLYTGAGDESQEVAALAARCFRGRDGDAFLGHLRNLTMNRSLGPEASEALLRHLEGQRQLVVYLTALVMRGRGGSPDDKNIRGEQ